MRQFNVFSIMVIIVVVAALAAQSWLFAEDESPSPTSEDVSEMSENETALPIEFETRQGAVVKVDGLRIYVDRGEDDGVRVGMGMEIYRMELIKDLQGNVLDEEEVKAGRMVVLEAKPKISIGELKEAKGSIERGFFVKYSTPVQAAAEAIDASIKCPPGMFYDGGGPFVYRPGAVSHLAKQPPETAGETGEFCIDQYVADEPLQWQEARRACELQGKRLCAMDELRKVCAIWEKPRPCPEQMQINNECEPSETVVGPGRTQEWTADMEPPPAGGVARLWANSCSCSARIPVCSRCFYEGCRGARKIYRCCSDPILLK